MEKNFNLFGAIAVLLLAALVVYSFAAPIDGKWRGRGFKCEYTVMNGVTIDSCVDTTYSEPVGIADFSGYTTVSAYASSTANDSVVLGILYQFAQDTGQDYYWKNIVVGDTFYGENTLEWQQLRLDTLQGYSYFRTGVIGLTNPDTSTTNPTDTKIWIKMVAPLSTVYQIDYNPEAEASEVCPNGNRTYKSVPR